MIDSSELSIMIGRYQQPAPAKWQGQVWGDSTLSTPKVGEPAQGWAAIGTDSSVGTEQAPVLRFPGIYITF